MKALIGFLIFFHYSTLFAVNYTLTPLRPGNKSRQYAELGEKILILENVSETECALYAFDRRDKNVRFLRNFFNVGGEGFTYLSPGTFGPFFYFMANDGAHGQELWRTDGTAAGTQLVIDLNPGKKTGLYSGIDKAWIAEDKIFFAGVTPETGMELFVTDGTAAGTKLCKQFTGGSTGTNIITGKVWKNRLVLSVISPDSKRICWVSDGTQSGTIPLLTSDQTSIVSPMGEFNGRFVLANSTKFWITNGTAAGTQLLKTLPVHYDNRGLANEWAVRSNRFYLMTYEYEPDEGMQYFYLWESDGTAGGTQIVFGPKEFVRSLRVLNDTLFVNYFSSLHYLKSGSLNDEWIGIQSDYTFFQGAPYFIGYIDHPPAKVSKLVDLTPTVLPLLSTEIGSNPHLFSNRVFLCWTDYDYFGRGPYSSRLWLSDGTPTGTTFVGYRYAVMKTLPSAYVVSNPAGEHMLLTAAGNAADAWLAYE